MNRPSPTNYVAARRFGDATVTVISDGYVGGKVALPLPESVWRPAIPEADAEGIIDYGLSFLHIQVGDASIVVDPSGLDDPSTNMVEDFAKHYPRYQLTPGLAGGLESIGVSAADVTHVLITHGHGDHLRGMITAHNGGQVPRFANATYYVGAGDWDSAARARRDSARALCYSTVEAAGQLQTVAAEREVAPGVTMIPAPGESPGHCIIRVQSGAASFYYLGDLFHYAAEVEHVDWQDPGRDPAAMRASRERLIAAVADTDAILLYTHAPYFPGWGRIVSTANGHRWEWA